MDGRNVGSVFLRAACPAACVARWRADAALARGWCGSASASPASADIKGSRFGPTAFSRRRGTSMRARAFACDQARRSVTSARMSSASTGICSYRAGGGGRSTFAVSAPGDQRTGELGQHGDGEDDAQCERAGPIKFAIAMVVETRLGRGLDRARQRRGRRRALDRGVVEADSARCAARLGLVRRRLCQCEQCGPQPLWL